MKRMRYSWIIMGMLVLAGGASAGVREESRLKKAQLEIDKHAAVWSDEEHAKALANQFKVPLESIQMISAKNQGWGAVNIELAMAWEMNKLHATTYPFVTVSLDQVEKMRAEGASWGEIAKKMDFGLGPVVKQTQDAANKLRKNNLAMTHKIQEAAKVDESQRIIEEEHQILKDRREEASR